MTKETTSVMKSAAAGIVTGGLAFMAVKTLTSSKRARRKTAAKTAKLIGNLMDSF